MNETTGRDFWDAAVSMTPAAQKLHSAADITSPFATNRLDLTIFVYCRNHETSIVSTLETIAEAMDVVGISYEILIIDDASKDQSTDLVRGFMAQYPSSNIVMRINKSFKGLSQNYFDGAFIGCGKFYRLVYGDNSEPVEMMVDIFRSTGDADIVVPYYISRLGQGAFSSFSANLLKGFLNLISGAEANSYMTDPMHLRYNVMRWNSGMLGPAFQMDLLCRVAALDFTCKQVPCRSAAPHTSLGKAGRVRRFLSVLHVIFNVILCRISTRLNSR